MPSFADSIFLFVLALLLFGPKKLPVLARELGKWVGEFRRASNEFKMQMEDELRASEQADKQKQIAAMEAAAPVPPPLGEPEEPEHPHLRPRHLPAEAPAFPGEENTGANVQNGTEILPQAAVKEGEETLDGVRPLPIAVSGELQMMPPATGLPTPRGRNGNPLHGGLLDAIPEVVTAAESSDSAVAEETAAHGD